MKEQLYLLADVARMLGCMPHRIVYLLTTGRVPEPPRLGNRRVFRPEDVRRIAACLGRGKTAREEAACATST